MINLTNLSDSLPVIIKDDATFEELKKDFPEILADLTTFKSNPNCSCRGRVNKFFSEKLEKDSTVLNKYIKNTEVLKTELDKVSTQRQANNYSGKIISLPKTEEAWKNFSDEMKSKFFRSFTVVEKENELVVYVL
jgi:hypothetical protein